MTPVVITPDWPAPKQVRAFSTTRRGGVSNGAWRSLNLGFGNGDSSVSVGCNRELLRAMLPDEPAWLKQVHGGAVVRHEQAKAQPEADAVVGSEAGQVCAVLTADCLPVLFADRNGHRVAAAHAGWRGLAAGVLERTVEAMDANATDILAWLGPGIGAANYQVGNDVRDAFLRQDSSATSAFEPDGECWLANLYALAQQRLLAAGVGEIYGGNHCTFGEPELFYSYRRDGVTGRMASVIWLE